MSDILITVGEAAQQLDVTSDLPSNKCLTKAEFDELVNGTPETGLTPDKAPNGVYIMHKNGRLFSKEYWKSPNTDASGVALKTDKCGFVIAKEEKTSIEWGGYGTEISGCFTTTNTEQAKTDFNGKSNTDAIVSQLGVYNLMVYNLDKETIINEAKQKAETYPDTYPEIPLTEEQIKIHEEFKNFLSLENATETQLYLITEEIRNSFKEQIKSTESISLLNEDILYIPTIDEVDKLTTEGIMMFMTRASNDYAANYCKKYTFLHGVNGYLGSLGEWNEAYQHKAEIDECMSKIGGKPLYDSSIYNYAKWSSTQYSTDHAWNLYWNNGIIYNYIKNYDISNNCARPFSAFQ